jgi:translation initiation factor IF-2
MRPAKPSGDSEKKGGGLMGRFGLGGDKKPADKDPKREGNRPALGRPAPGDSSKAGAALGGITAGVTGAFSGLTSRFSRDKDGKGAKPGKPGDKPAKPAGDNKSGGFFSRNKTPEPTKGGTPASSASSGFGSRPGGGTGSGFGAAGTPGAARPGAPSPGGAKPAGKDAKGPRTGLGARLMAPFRSLGPHQQDAHRRRQDTGCPERGHVARP